MNFDNKNNHIFTGASSSGLKLQLMEQKSYKKKISLNVPEKIVFVIDTVREFSSPEFKLSTGQKYKILYILKRAVEIFLHNKLMLNQKHEFALVYIDSNKAEWLCGFTGNLKLLLNKLESIEECIPDNNKSYFDLQQIFNLIYQKVIHEKSVLEDNVVRIILLYCRSNIIPRFNTTNVIMQEIISNPNFFLDILYVHEIPSLDNKCEEIYSELNKLDIKSVSYIMELSRNVAKLHNYMARLLAHPAQRVSQNHIEYSIHPTILSIIDEYKLHT
ncbi:BRISC and BRCA1-A complex member 1 [Nasonia vitripennis]|uniref:BRISC and BRCA1-A complex member 1 n=1 Tax=Nasonia vitripennis TaxID=7425 RepID=A0A7M7H759_NASVI|nr:BRISC and BRCA1-A complex member 1 [Nasonia vitripennis]XP_031784718.1 BRISC and BRCA1-A complex member 1 [Nasonia vitripennis]